MADIVELTIKRLPFEVVNIVFSFLGTSPSADLVKDALEDMLEYNDCFNFYNEWKKCVSLNIKLNQIRKKPKFAINITRNYLKIDNLECQSCHCNCLLDDYINYGKRCEWCYAEVLGHEVFSCYTCGDRFIGNDNLWETENGKWYCNQCVNQSESEDEDDEDEFWEDEDN